MRHARRFWVAAAIAGVVLVVGAVARDPALVGAGLVLGLWLFAHGVGFVRTVRTLADADVSLETVRDRVAVDAPLVVRVRVTAPTALPVTVTVVPRLPPSADRASTDRSFVLAGGDRAAETTFETGLRVAGRSTIGPVVGSFRDDGGLFAGTVRWDRTTTVGVQPRTPRDLHVGEGGDPLASLYGEHPTEITGAGLDPAGVREYVPGDQLSRIDWKATARLNHPHIREFQMQTTHETLLVIDHRASMGVGPVGENKLSSLREVALAFVDAATEFDDPLGLYAVGDDGTTTTRDAAVGVDQYGSIRRTIAGLEPTPSSSSSPSAATDDRTTPAQAQTAAARLGADDSRFARTLRPYLGATQEYVHRLADRPLFRTVRAGGRRLGSGAWTVLLTDDTRPAEVYEAAKLARGDDGRVLVFLAPSVLYESPPDGPDDALDRYVSFEKFRASLAAIDRVSAFEVAPRDRIAAVIARQERLRRSRRSATRGPRRYRADDGDRQNPLAYSGPPPAATDAEGSTGE